MKLPMRCATCITEERLDDGSMFCEHVAWNAEEEQIGPRERDGYVPTEITGDCCPVCGEGGICGEWDPKEYDALDEEHALDLWEARNPGKSADPTICAVRPACACSADREPNQVNCPECEAHFQGTRED